MDEGDLRQAFDKRYPVPPGMCSPRRPFFKYHGPGPDHRSPGAMEICYMVVAEKDEGENKRGEKVRPPH